MNINDIKTIEDYEIWKKERKEIMKRDAMTTTEQESLEKLYEASKSIKELLDSV